ncbi:MAG: restriction endonuclease subunit S [Flavobacteriaceae bacterium]|nr:restriction endonuclease subunit S [Flavobacteriaceae bacterium]
MSFENNIPEGWIDTTLGEVCDKMYSGGTPSTKREDYYGGDIPWIRTQEVKFNYILDAEIKITDLGLKNSSARYIPKNTIIIAMYGNSAGRVAYSKIEATTNQACCNFVSDKDECVPSFVYFNLLGRYKEIEGKANGAAQQNLSVGVLKELSINLPPLPEQKAIAKVLTAFDDKIELLQAQNKTLENMAQTIFKEWFGKYQIGDELPEGWRVRELRDLAEKISKGTTPRKNDVQGKENTIFFLKVKDISDDGLISNKNLALIPKEVHRNQLKRSILESNDILFSIAGTIGRVAILHEELNDCNCNQAIAFIRLKNKNEFLEYVHLWIKSKEIQTEINSSIVQGVQANVSLTVLGDLKIILPSDSTMLRWKGIIKPIYNKIYNNNNQIKSLTKTRDNLLPKLMSGQVRVNNIKQTADA